MASRTRVVPPRTKKDTQPSQSPIRSSDRKPPAKQPKKSVHRDEGFTVVEPNATRRQNITNAAAREESQYRQFHQQRRVQAAQSINNSGPTINRLGGSGIDMQEVRRRQVEQAEAQLRRARGSFPTLSSDK